MPPNNQNFFPGYMSSKAINSTSSTPHAVATYAKANRPSYGAAKVKRLPIQNNNTSAKTTKPSSATKNIHNYLQKSSSVKKKNNISI